MKTKIAIFTIVGSITEQEYPTSYIDLMFSQIYQGDFGHLIIRISSNGGTLAYAQEIAERVLSFQKAGGMVFVSIGETCTSAAFYLSLFANQTFCLPASTLGSIGIVFEESTLSNVLSHLGLKKGSVKSGDYKNPFSSQPLDNENRKMLQRVAEDLHQQFTKKVLEKSTKAEHVCNGEIFTGQYAKSIGLVDALGGMETILDTIANDGKIIIKYLNEPKTQDKKGILNKVLNSVINKILWTIRKPPDLQAVRKRILETYISDKKTVITKVSESNKLVLLIMGKLDKKI